MENDKQPLKKVSISQHLPKSNVDEVDESELSDFQKFIKNFPKRDSHSGHLPKPIEIKSNVNESKPIAVQLKSVSMSDHLPKVKEPTTNVVVAPKVVVDELIVKKVWYPNRPITDEEWDELNRGNMAIAKSLQRKKRPQKYNTTYCFNLSKAQLEALSTYAKFNNTSKSNCIRKAITEMLNKGRI